MDYSRNYRQSTPRAMSWVGLESWGLVRGMAVFALAGVVPMAARAQQAATGAPALVFDGVTVVDVEQGKLLPALRVVIVGNRIQDVGGVRGVKTPKGAQVVNARGKYLIPGLWDMHTHTDRRARLVYPLFVVNGVTGIRDAGSPVPLDTLIRWRREIVAGTRVGPPRQILSGQSIGDSSVDARSFGEMYPLIFEELARQITREWRCRRNELLYSPQNCVVDLADARRVVDSLKVAGADMIKPRGVERETYFAIAAEARRLRIRFGGHVNVRGGPAVSLTPIEASDSGASIIDHPVLSGCWGRSASVMLCRPVADRFRRNGTWWVPTLTVHRGAGGTYAHAIFARYAERAKEFWTGSPFQGNWLDKSAAPAIPRTSDADSRPDSIGAMRVAQRSGLPMLAGTDDMRLAGFGLHAELAMYAAEGLTPLEALQTATLNPAKFWRATDSLGTVAPGKLADLVLLDADPLADITNTTAIHAVMANGRYYDRAALDQLLAEVQAKAKADKAESKP